MTSSDPSQPITEYPDSEELGRELDDTGVLLLTFNRPDRNNAWTYTLEDYARAIEAAGLAIERLREPLPAEADETGRAASDVWRRVPLFQAASIPTAC